MALEIERKFLVRDESFIAEATSSSLIAQAYLSVRPTVRLRLRDEEAYITIKGASHDGGLSRSEWEYTIPVDEAREMMRLAHGRVVEKRRYIVPHAGHEWEVDVFVGDYEGLILAELELSSGDEDFVLPPWVAEEVTGEPQYYNAAMALGQGPQL
ncbi:MAG: CYTH domain-containing protein [Porphyromonas sp.]|nr:CYTH domain-containing protein [Porphyromonas sp.]